MEYLSSSVQLRREYSEVLKVLCKEVNSMHSLRCLRELEQSVISDLSVFDLDVRKYSDPLQLILDRQVTAMISKYPLLHCKEDPVENCLQTYYKFEEQCQETNERLSSGRLPEPDVSAVMFTARRKIDKILGRLPEVQDLSFTFGPGATRNVSRRTSAFHKISAKPECTFRALVPSLRLVASVPRLWTLWGGTEFDPPKMNIVPGSRFGQVPKNAKTNRPIDVEPTLNGVLQRGYGEVIRNRLGRVGNCIRSGQQRHAELARVASVRKDLATIDFSGASDSIASILVLDLLPPDWFDALDTVRSHCHRINGKDEVLHKFSSMGNGFTFELETLIFLALARATCNILELPVDDVSVYGDDVILPTDAMPLFEKVCDWCGFTINREKSFYGSDSFRESCGADWMDGIDVRVAYMRHEPSPHYLTTLHNRLFTLGISEILPKTMERLVRAIPKKFRNFGPPTEHTYGYLHSYEYFGKPTRVVRIVPRQHSPKGRAILPYAMYSSQFCGDYSSERVPWDKPLDMSRFAVRSDIKVKLSSRLNPDGSWGKLFKRSS